MIAADYASTKRELTGRRFSPESLLGVTSLLDPASGMSLLAGGLMKDVTASRPRALAEEIKVPPPPSSARSLLKYAGRWKGDDLEELLEDVYSSRGEAEF